MDEVAKFNLGISIIKFVLGVICYGLVCCYTDLNNLVGPGTSSIRLDLLAIQILSTACVAFTFVIEPAVIVATIHTPKHYFRTLLGPLFSFAGFVCYITSGSLMLANKTFTNYPSPNPTPFLIAKSLFIITGVVYLAHCIYAGYARFKTNTVKPGYNAAQGAEKDSHYFREMLHKFRT